MTTHITLRAKVARHAPGRMALTGAGAAAVRAGDSRRPL